MIRTNNQDFLIRITDRLRNLKDEEEDIHSRGITAPSAVDKKHSPSADADRTPVALIEMVRTLWT